MKSFNLVIAIFVLLLFSAFGFTQDDQSTSDFPHYRDGVLIIPRVDNGCLTVGGIHQRLKNNRFEITVNAVRTVARDGSIVCTQALIPFEKMAPLQVYGLPRGIYDYMVNGEIEGSFELIEDNIIH